MIRKIRRSRGFCGFAALALAGIVSVLASTLPSAAAEAQEPPSVERIVLRFRDGAFEILSRRDLQRPLPPSDDLPGPVGEVSGFWFEIQDEEGQPRYRRVMGNPIRLVFEGPDLDEPGSGIPDRKEGIPRERVFAVLVPDPQPGDELVLFSSPIELGAQAEPAREIARFELDPVLI